MATKTVEMKPKASKRTKKTTTVAVENNNEQQIINAQVKDPIDKIFFADVKKVPAKEIFPGFKFNSYNDTAIVVNYDGEDIVVNNCSSNYLLLPNREIFPTLEAELAKFGDVQIKREVRNDSSFFVTYDFLSPERRIEIAGKDIIFPRISIENSYNSRNLFSVESGFFRCVCTNGLCLPVEDSTFNTILSHCNGNLEKIIANTLEGINHFLEGSKEIAGEYEVLMEQKVPKSEVAEYVEKILKGTKSLISYKDLIVERILKENVEQAIELNMFSIYNGINWALQPHNNSKIEADPSTRAKTDGKILDFIFDKMIAA